MSRDIIVTLLYGCEVNYKSLIMAPSRSKLSLSHCSHLNPAQASKMLGKFCVECGHKVESYMANRETVIPELLHIAKQYDNTNTLSVGFRYKLTKDIALFIHQTDQQATDQQAFVGVHLDDVDILRGECVMINPCTVPKKRIIDVIEKFNIEYINNTFGYHLIPEIC